MGATLSLSSAVELVPLMTPLPAPPSSTGKFFEHLSLCLGNSGAEKSVTKRAG
ncbi:MAG: hypothetical protein HKK67_03400 [Chlorobiaceae bacterium]|nr:hypothetical protein [Chlorobiaceae bacterium]